MEQQRPIIQLEEQFKIMADTAPVLIWIAGLDKLCYFFNAGWLRFTGRTLEQEYGNGWAEGVHSEDYDRCLNTYVAAFDQRKDFSMEYRLKRYDGQYRWVTDNGVPRYDQDGNFVGYIGTCVDVHQLLEDQQIKTELLSSKALLKEQDLNEELAATNEEIAAANEELLAANEELCSAQEILATMNLGLEEIVAIRTKELTSSENRYKTLVANAPVAIGTLTGKDMVITSANDMLLKFWGKGKNILGKKLTDALPEIKNQIFQRLLDDVFTTSVPYEGNEVKTLLEDKGELKTFYFNFIYAPLKNENGETESIMVVAIDVTEQVESREEVEYVRNRLRSMVATAPIGMTILKGRNLVVEIANAQMLEVWHRDRDQVMGKPIWDIFPELEGREFKALINSVFETGKPVKIPEVLSPHPEKESYIDLSYYPIFDQNGRAESILVTVIEITELVNNRKSIEQNQYDLQAINEELLSSNEELLSSNHHLEKIRNELERTMAEVSAKENRFSFMLNAIPQQVWTADPTGALAYVNDVVCEDFGYTKAEIVGHGWQEFIHPEDIDSCLEKWHAALTTGQEYMVEFRLRFADGDYYWHLGRALPLIEEGGVSLWIGTNTNIQVQKENEEIKDEFLSIASHELKTPLTTIKAFNQLMIRANKAEGMEKYLKKSAEQIFRLEKLITDLLDVTKINAGKMSYNLETFNFGEMIASSVESMQQTAINHELILKDSISINYIGDRFRLEQVLHNFLSNAIKYSPNGKKVIISYFIDQKNIIVSIKDFGIGIAKDKLSKIFERYYRVDNTSMRFEGLGLGLFISSEILKRHQGNFWIDSKEGEGSTFYFGLPIQQTKPQQTIKQDDFYQDDHITLSYVSKNNMIYADWKGFQNLNSIQNAGAIALEMINKYKVSKILNDNTQVMGTWSEASDYIGGELLPMMYKAGLRQMAWIYSPNSFSQLSAQKSVDFLTEDVNVKFFTDNNKAKIWLES